MINTAKVFEAECVTSVPEKQALKLQWKWSFVSSLLHIAVFMSFGVYLPVSAQTLETFGNKKKQKLSYNPAEFGSGCRTLVWVVLHCVPIFWNNFFTDN